MKKFRPFIRIIYGIWYLHHLIKMLWAPNGFFTSNTYLMALWIVLKLVLLQRATPNNRASTSLIHLVMLSRLQRSELFYHWSSQIIGLSGNLTSKIHFLMAFYRKRFIWINPLAMLILNILHIFVGFFELSMASNKLHKHGSITSALFSGLVALLIILLTHFYFFSLRMMTWSIYYSMLTILSWLAAIQHS